MRRHSAMDFVAGVMVFPGGGVDDRDRNADIAWSGPEPSWWAQRLGVDTDLAEALVCAAARETFEESGVLFAGPADDRDGIVGDASVYRESRLALADNSLSFGEFLRTEKLVLRADLLRPWANWVTPKEERTRRYDTYFFVGALPEGQRADGENTETDQAGWTTPEAALDDFAEGRTFLLPPTWTQLDSLAGHTVAEVLAVERQIVPVEPHLDVTQGQLGDRVLQQRPLQRGAAPSLAMNEFVSVHVSDEPARHRHAGAVAAADQRDDPPGVPRDRRRVRRPGPARGYRRGDRVRRA